MFTSKISSIAWDAVYLFFQPLRKYRANIEEIHSDENFNQDELTIPLRYLKIVQESTCYNQGAFSQYWYMAAQKHKLIRLTLEKSRKNAQNKALLEKLNSELVHFLNQEFHSAALKNFSFIHSYFGNRNVTPPRVCIKGYFQTEDKDKVITVFRDREESYDETPTLIGENTGFDYVHENGKFYLSNDLLKDALKGKYKNPRIDLKKLPRSNFLLVSKQRKWQEIWKTSSSTNNSKYRSTLILPLTFWNNSLKKDFLNALDILPETKRTIFGFLCIDHEQPNYFKKEADVSMGYYFADILSQYLFSRLVYTKLSKTIENAEEVINNNNEYDVSLEENIEDLKKSILGSLEFKSVSEIAKSSKHENYRYKLDEKLLSYLKLIQKKESYDSKSS